MSAQGERAQFITFNNHVPKISRFKAFLQIWQKKSAFIYKSGESPLLFEEGNFRGRSGIFCQKPDFFLNFLKYHKKS